MPAWSPKWNDVSTSGVKAGGASPALSPLARSAIPVHSPSMPAWSPEMSNTWYDSPRKRSNPFSAESTPNPVGVPKPTWDSTVHSPGPVPDTPEESAIFSPPHVVIDDSLIRASAAGIITDDKGQSFPCTPTIGINKPLRCRTSSVLSSYIITIEQLRLQCLCRLNGPRTKCTEPSDHPWSSAAGDNSSFDLHEVASCKSKKFSSGLQLTIPISSGTPTNGKSIKARICPLTCYYRVKSQSSTQRNHRPTVPTGRAKKTTAPMRRPLSAASPFVFLGCFLVPASQ